MINGVVQPIDPVPSKPVSFAQGLPLETNFGAGLAQVGSAQELNPVPQKIHAVPLNQQKPQFAEPAPPQNKPAQNTQEELDEILNKERQIEPSAIFFIFRGLIVRKFQQRFTIRN